MNTSLAQYYSIKVAVVFVKKAVDGTGQNR